MGKKNKQQQQQNTSSNVKQTFISPQDRLFNSHISYLFKFSYLNLTNMESTEQAVSRHSLKLIKKLTNKKPLKLSPDLKYFYCKNCDNMLVPDLTSRIRVKSKRTKHIVNTCLACGAIKRYNLKLK